MEYYQPHLIVKYMIYFLIVWFFIASFSKKARKVNLIILSMYVANIILIPEINQGLSAEQYFAHYIKSIELLVSIDVFFGLLMLAANGRKINPYLFKQWSLLSFAVMCHCMILWDLSVSQTLLTGLFYALYDELIIIIGVLQVWISRDGILGIIGRLQVSYNGAFLSNILRDKNLLKRKTSKVKT